MTEKEVDRGVQSKDDDADGLTPIKEDCAAVGGSAAYGCGVPLAGKTTLCAAYIR